METVGIVEAAQIMHVNRKTVEEKIHSGELAAARVGRAYVMMRSDVVTLVEKEIIRQTAERMRSPLSTDSRGRAKSRKAKKITKDD